MVSVKTLMIYHMRCGTITPSASPLASVISSVKLNSQSSTRGLWFDSLRYPVVFPPPERLPKPWLTSSSRWWYRTASVHAGAEPRGSQPGFQNKISVNWRDEVTVNAAEATSLGPDVS